VPEPELSKWKNLYNQMVDLLLTYFSKSDFIPRPWGPSPVGVQIREKLKERNALVAAGILSSDPRVLAAEAAAKSIAAQKVLDSAKLNALVTGLRAIAVRADPLLRRFPDLLNF